MSLRIPSNLHSVRAWWEKAGGKERLVLDKVEGDLADRETERLVMFRVRGLVKEH